jgi:hypothetical protein
MSRALQYRIVLLAAASLLSLFAGCSNLVNVQGEVTLDGKPLPNAKIMLMPKGGGRPAEGTSDAAGKFRLTTNKPFDGIAPGEYIVTVTARTIAYEAKPGTEQGFIEKPTWHAPEKYSLPAQSGLVATVVAGKKELKLELSSKP